MITPAGKAYPAEGPATMMGQANGPWFGLSTDTEPQNARNGAILYLMDTGVVKMYDEANQQWREQ